LSCASSPKNGCDGDAGAHHHLRELGWEINRKRVQRIWREEELRVPVRKRKRRRLGGSTVPAERLHAERPNHVWAFDFQFDQTADGRALKLLNIVDEFTREALVMLVERSIDADTVVATLERLCAQRGAPELLRCDNGPEMTAHAPGDWCQLSKTGTVVIEPGSAWQNPFVESLHSRIRDELLDVEEFCNLAEARMVIGDWREDYHLRRPRSGCSPQPPSPPNAPPAPPTAKRPATLLHFYPPSLTRGRPKSAGRSGPRGTVTARCCGKDTR
jgi:putative transposase